MMRYCRDRVPGHDASGCGGCCDCCDCCCSWRGGNGDCGRCTCNWEPEARRWRLLCQLSGQNDHTLEGLAASLLPDTGEEEDKEEDDDDGEEEEEDSPPTVPHTSSVEEGEEVEEDVPLNASHGAEEEAGEEGGGGEEGESEYPLVQSSAHTSQIPLLEVPGAGGVAMAFAT